MQAVYKAMGYVAPKDITVLILCPGELSFKGALQTFNAFLP